MRKEINYYLAFDLGASSGRAILGEISSDKIKITEIHRFPNNFIKINGHFYWNIYNLFGELLAGLEKFFKNYTFKLESIGIDTWGVDFAFLDKSGNILNLPLAYRDHITDDIIEKYTSEVMDAKSLYQITGLQFMKFNSLFQLYALLKKNRERRFHHNTIAIVYDFDGTLTPRPMQEYTVLPDIGVKPKEFWASVKEDVCKTHGDEMLAYMRLLIETIEKKERTLSKTDLRKMAKKIRYYPGVTRWFQRINKYVRTKSSGDIKLKHYIISAGLKEILNGISWRRHSESA